MSSGPWIRLAAAAVGVLLTLTACGGDDVASPDGSPTPSVTEEESETTSEEESSEPTESETTEDPEESESSESESEGTESESESGGLNDEDLPETTLTAAERRGRSPAGVHPRGGPDPSRRGDRAAGRKPDLHRLQRHRRYHGLRGPAVVLRFGVRAARVHAGRQRLPAQPVRQLDRGPQVRAGRPERRHRGVVPQRRRRRGLRQRRHLSPRRLATLTRVLGAVRTSSGHGTLAR